MYDSLDLTKFKSGEVHEFWLKIVDDGRGVPMLVPVIVYKGKKNGPVLGVIAAIHGNELNGIAVIHTLKTKLPDPSQMAGTIILVPGLNIPGIINEQREFNDGQDLNRLFPGKKRGDTSQQYVYNLYRKLIVPMDYLVDLHTASFGRTNSLYVRADMKDEALRNFALLQPADIILNSDGAPSASNTGSGETLRAYAHRNNIPGITIELGNPQVFQTDYTDRGAEGILQIITYLKIIKGQLNYNNTAQVCVKSYWIYTSKGGYLYNVPELNKQVLKGDIIGTLKDSFGEIIEEYFAPENGIIIGNSSNPVSQTGGRIVHLGVMKE